MSLIPLQTAYESFVASKEHLSLDIYFEQTKALIIQAMEENNVAYIEKLMTEHLLPLAISNRNYEVFYLLKESEHYFKRHAKHLLALYYRTLGHTLYFRFEFEKANAYYKFAISHSLENRDYVGLATAMNNFTLKGFNTLPEDVGLTIAKSIPLILKIGNDYTINELISKLFFYIEFAILQGKAEYVEVLLNNIVEGEFVKGHERYELQLKILQSIMWTSKNEPLKARDLYLEIIQRCVETKSHHDLLIHVYQELVNLKLSTDDLIFDSSVHEAVDQLEKSLKEENQMMHKYLEKNQALKPLKFNRPFGVKPELFKYVASLHLKKLEEDGNTLLLIDCLLMTPNSTELLNVLALLNDEMTAEFREQILVVTIIDDTSVAYILPLSEADLRPRIYKVFEQVRARYPKGDSILKNIYFASVNNKENNLMTVEDCLNLAYAYIYYELQ